MRVDLSRNGEESFLSSLKAAGIPYETFSATPGQIMASGTMIAIAQTAAISGALATVLVAWIKARASRKIILTLEGHKVVHLEGYTVEQVQELLPLVDRLSAIDTQPAEQSNNSFKPKPLRGSA